MKLKQLRPLLALGLAAVLSLAPASVAFAEGGSEGSGSAVSASGKAEITGKDEVIYAVLTSGGSVRSMYAVNHFTIAQGGEITDYGDYASVVNLTDTAPMAHENDTVTLVANGENFYYQGNMAGAELPWIFGISYALDGVKTTPQELAGSSGALEIHITTKQNAAVNPAFYEGYMLQISITLDTETCSDIQAPGASVASAGKNKVLAYTVLPGRDADISLSADVRDFTMTGIDIAALPFSMSMELPDTDGMMNNFSQLSDAISNLNQGVGGLAKGTAELKSGATQLTEGSSGIKAGLSQLTGNSAQLIQASSQISGALALIASSLNGPSGELNLGDLTQLPQGLSQLAEGLAEISGGLVELKTGFTAAYGALDGAIQGIPSTAISQEQIAALYGQTDASQHALLDQLVASYAAGQTVKGTYNQVKGAFDAVGSATDNLSSSIDTISTELATVSKKIGDALSGMDMVQQLAQLSAGLSKLNQNYAAFHSGLQEYMNGLGALSSGYADFHSGLSSFGSGIGGLHAGVAELHNGTARLKDETASMPDTVQTEIDEMLNQYLGSEFEPISFTSSKNLQTNQVQFVLKCDGIEKPEDVATAEAELSTETVWDRIVSLFTDKK